MTSIIYSGNVDSDGVCVYVRVRVQLEAVERVQETALARQEAASMAQTLIAREKAEAETKERAAQAELKYVCHFNSTSTCTRIALVL
jgi:hypothetical protein